MNGRDASGELLTVNRALRVLRSFTEDRPSRGVTELAAELELDKSQVHRVLTTLGRQGFTVFDPATRRYTLGPALVVLGHRAERSPGIQRQVEPQLRNLSRITGESTVLCVPDGVRYKTVAAADGPGMLRYAASLGNSYPGHLGASGHAIFAFHRAITPAELLLAHEEADENAEAALARSHEQVRQDGYAISVGEFDARVMAISAPVRVEGSVFGSVSALGPPEYMHERSETIVAAVLATASDLGATLQG